MLRALMLQKIDEDGTNVKFDDVINDCNNFSAMKADSQLIIGNDVQLNAVRHSQQRRKKQPQKFQPTPPPPCSRCGEPTGTRTARTPSTNAASVPELIISNLKCRKPKWHDVQNGTVYESSHLIRKTFNVNGVPVEFCLDTGAEVNFLNETLCGVTGKQPLQKCEEFGSANDECETPFLGKGPATYKYDDINTAEDFFLSVPELWAVLESTQCFDMASWMRRMRTSRKEPGQSRTSLT
ncbi:hypothetical protein Tcan_06533 [Toxocara canis]|uniref:Peptidase A2 domain-containing protein n=1 Tax=Toxocara canis TaxID=6265 RepID=A0A0B2VPD8_TOXCA|nr:hypothetical protein Tcan_06533 [Toxocara canis]